MESSTATPENTVSKSSSPVGYLKILGTILLIVIIFVFIFLQIKKHKQPNIKVETKEITFLNGQVTYILKPGETIRYEDEDPNTKGRWSSIGYSPKFISECSGKEYETTNLGRWESCSSWRIENRGDKTISITYSK